MSRDTKESVVTAIAITGLVILVCSVALWIHQIETAEAQNNALVGCLDYAWDKYTNNTTIVLETAVKSAAIYESVMPISTGTAYLTAMVQTQSMSDMSFHHDMEMCKALYSRAEGFEGTNYVIPDDF